MESFGKRALDLLLTIGVIAALLVFIPWVPNLGAQQIEGGVVLGRSAKSSKYGNSQYISVRLNSGNVVRVAGSSLNEGDRVQVEKTAALIYGPPKYALLLTE